MKNRSRKALILAVWMILLGISGTVLAVTEGFSLQQKPLQNLADMADTLSGQIQEIIVMNSMVLRAMEKAQTARVKALAHALEEKEDILQTDELLNDFAQDTGVDGLFVYDREGRTLFRHGESTGLTSEEARLLLETGAFRQRDAMIQTEACLNDPNFADGRPAEENMYGWNTDDNRLLVCMYVTQTEAQKSLSAFFDWQNALQSFRIGRAGQVLTLDKEEGTVLSCADRDLWGSSFNVLSIRPADGNRTLSFPELREVFDGNRETVRIVMNGIPYYARFIEQDYAFMLALLPEKEALGTVAGEVATLMLLLVLVTGICVAFALFHLRDPETVQPRRKGRFGWRETLAARLKVAGVLAVAFVLIAGLYLGALSSYAETFRYTRGKADGMVKFYDENIDIYNILEDWFGVSMYQKSESAGSILQCTEPEKQSREFLTELAERLDVKYIGRYDRNGTLAVTNAPFFQETLEEDDPFRKLLKGLPSFTAPRELDMSLDASIQKSGSALQNTEGLPDGMVILATDTKDIDTIQNYVDFGDDLLRLGLMEKTAVLAVGEEDGIILYNGESKDGILQQELDGSDAVGDKIRELGIPETALRDRFNGNLRVMDRQYFASVRRMDGFWIMVMLPQTGMESRYLIPVGIAAGTTLLFALLLILCACSTGREWIGTETGIPAAERKAENPEPPDGDATNQKEKQDEVLAMLGSFIYREKPYFEERWPEDFTPWKKRSTGSRFMTVLRCILIFVLAAILIHTVTAGENSVWYYCFNGEWERGINLYSLTSCLITLGLLLVGKIVIHKLLYLIARAVNARGETICHLLDSFSDYFLWFAGIFICLANIGVNTETLSLTGGVAGGIFGIGCQNVVADILSGILMTLEGVARVGDFVSFNGNYAVVLSVGVRTTRLKWYGTITPVRNNEFKNFVYLPSEQENRVLVPLTIDMNEPLDRVERILEEELPEIHRKLCESVGEQVTGPIYRGIKSFTDNGYVVSLSFFCRGKYFGWLNRQLNRELKSMCDRRGIRIALPQVVIHGAGTRPEETESGNPGQP